MIKNRRMHSCDMKPPTESLGYAKSDNFMRRCTMDYIFEVTRWELHLWELELRKKWTWWTLTKFMPLPYFSLMKIIVPVIRTWQVCHKLFLFTVSNITTLIIAQVCSIAFRRKFQRWQGQGNFFGKIELREVFGFDVACHYLRIGSHIFLVNLHKFSKFFVIHNGEGYRTFAVQKIKAPNFVSQNDTIHV